MTLNHSIHYFLLHGTQPKQIALSVHTNTDKAVFTNGHLRCHYPTTGSSDSRLFFSAILYTEIHNRATSHRLSTLSLDQRATCTVATSYVSDGRIVQNCSGQFCHMGPCASRS